MQITITEEDITYGLPCNCYECPIARAFEREGIRVAVGDKVIHLLSLTDNGFARQVRLTSRLENWRRTFDHTAFYGYEPCKPITFEWDKEKNEFI